MRTRILLFSGCAVFFDAKRQPRCYDTKTITTFATFIRSIRFMYLNNPAGGSVFKYSTKTITTFQCWSESGLVTAVSPSPQGQSPSPSPSGQSPSPSGVSPSPLEPESESESESIGPESESSGSESESESASPTKVRVSPDLSPDSAWTHMSPTIEKLALF